MTKRSRRCCCIIHVVVLLFCVFRGCCCCCNGSPPLHQVHLRSLQGRCCCCCCCTKEPWPQSGWLLTRLLFTFDLGSKFKFEPFYSDRPRQEATAFQQHVCYRWRSDSLSTIFFYFYWGFLKMTTIIRKFNTTPYDWLPQPNTTLCNVSFRRKISTLLACLWPTVRCTRLLFWK